MSLISNPVYKSLEESLGTYAAVMQMAKATREIEASLDNRITTSSALDFACNGLTPDPKDYPDVRLDRVKDYITYVTDTEVKASIIRSYEQSLAKNNLVYDYTTIDDEPRRSRVRIIMNILWDQRPHKKY